MKDKPVVIVITLLGGAVAAVSCLINGAGLTMTLLLVLISLVAFLIIGIVANKIYARIKDELESKMARERVLRESAEFEREKRENELAIARANGELPESKTEQSPAREPQEPQIDDPNIASKTGEDD
ncbi:MAG: hypothetical protein K6F44_06375 [Lachnospiraceae bacterium]|nr:hypothetical protein [Lachnospiraceae bacterium]